METTTNLRYIITFDGPASTPYQINIFDKTEGKAIKSIQHPDDFTGKQIRAWYQEEVNKLDKEVHLLNFPVQTNLISKSEALNEFATLLLNNGFTIIAPKEASTWFHFSKDNKIGYVQDSRFAGCTFSTVHKPCKECGTGFRFTDANNGDDWHDLTIENANSVVNMIAPNWAKRQDVNAVRKYKDVAEFTAQYFYKNSRIINPTVNA